MRRHPRRYFAAWKNGRLDDGARRAIERHLDECGECREYFGKMSLLFDGMNPSRLPRLAPDVDLPARIRRLAARPAEPTRAARAPRLGWARLSFGTLMVAAAAIGVYLGNALSNGAADDATLARAYYEAFSQGGYSSGWEALLADASPETGGE